MDIILTWLKMLRETNRMMMIRPSRERYLIENDGMENYDQ